MEIKTIEQRLIWDEFFDQVGSPSFLQSWEWGEFQKKQGNESVYLGLYEKNKLVATALTIKIKAKRGSFLFIPHGPNVKDQSMTKKAVDEFKRHLITVAKQENYDFIRIAPVLADTPDNRNIYLQLGFKKSPIYMHAERVWVLDLDKSEEELLAGMRKTTRYLVKKADRDGVLVERRKDNQAVDVFWSIYLETAKRENFVPFSKRFINDEFKTFHESGNCEFVFGKVGKEYLGSALIVFTKSSGFYHQGASIHTKFPVPYRLQWEAMKEAKKRGCRTYNFWGILQEGRSPRNWQGLTMFKKGFGGRQVDYVPTQDFILSPIKYTLTYLYECLLRIKRGV